MNLHTDWMFLRVTDVILFKNSAALKHAYLLKYLLENPEKYEVCTYLNSHCFSLYQKGSEKVQRFLRPIGFIEHKWIMKKNNIDEKTIRVLKNKNEIKENDIVISYNIKSAGYIGLEYY